MMSVQCHAEAAPAFVLQYEGGDGATVEATISSATALDANDLRSLKANPPRRLSIEGFSDEVSMNGEPLPGSKILRIGNLDLTASPGVFALVDGGWLPPPLVASRHFLVDSNIVIDMGGVPGIAEGAPRFEGRFWWFRFLEHDGLMLNPLPFAMEGKSRRTPSLADFQSLFRQGVSRIQSVLPKVCITSHTDATLEGAYDLLKSLASRSERELQFLCRVGAVVWEASRKKDRMQQAREICLLADRAGISRSSLPSVCALACVFPAEGGTPANIGQRVLKPSPRYREQDAHNALTDLRHIEMAAAGHAAFGAQSPVLLTQDYWLALLWSALSPHGCYGTHGELNFRFNVDHDLFQDLDAEELETLVELIKSGP